MAKDLKFICNFVIGSRTLVSLADGVDLRSGKRKVRATQSTILSNSELSVTVE